MSKFIDNLKKLSEGSSQPMGFGRAQAAPARSKIQLIALVEGSASGQAATDADALIIRVQDLASAKTTIKELAEKTAVPLGISVPDSIGTEAMEESGADFVVFPTGLPVSGFAETKLGKIVEIGLDITDSILRTLNAVPVDAVMIRQGGRAANLSWQDLIAVQRITISIGKPVILSVPSSISKGELQMLWNARIDAVVVAAAQPDEIKRVKEIIKGLKFPEIPREHTMAMVPRPSLEPQHHEEDDEEDDE